jgi:hypothetical protein
MWPGLVALRTADLQVERKRGREQKNSLADDRGRTVVREAVKVRGCACAAVR